MKKIFFALSVLVLGLLCSCQNDEIPMDKQMTFKINPQTVISSFSNYRSDLEDLKGATLRVRLFIYNENGALVAQGEKELTTFLQLANISMSIPEGKYRAVAVSDVVSGGSGCWSVSGEKSISSLTLTDTGNAANGNNILGVATEQFTSGVSQQNIDLNLKPIGAVFYVYFANIHTLNNVSAYQLLANKTNDAVMFDAQGKITSSIKMEEGSSYRLARVNPNDFTGDPNVYVLNYMFPMSNLMVYFEAETSDGDGQMLGKALMINDIKVGQEYKISIDLSKAGSGFDVKWQLFDSNASAPLQEFDPSNGKGAPSSSKSIQVAKLI